MEQLLHLEKQGRKSRPRHVHCRSLSFKHLVVVVEDETINMQQERKEIFKINKDEKKRGDRESSSLAAEEGEGSKKSKSSSPLIYTIPPPPPSPSSFSKFISMKKSKVISFSKWSINHHDKMMMMMMKTIVNGGAACVYVVGEGEDPAVWRRRRKKAGRSSGGNEGYELCRRRILMGERCKPLNISGKLQYDETGILLPEDIST